MKGVITMKDWYWDESIKNMVFEDEKGDKYKGKAHDVAKRKVYSVEIEPADSKDGYINIIRWL